MFICIKIKVLGVELLNSACGITQVPRRRCEMMVLSMTGQPSRTTGQPPRQASQRRYIYGTQFN